MHPDAVRHHLPEIGGCRVTDHEKGQRDGHWDALNKLKRLAFGHHGSPEYIVGYQQGQEAGRKERADLDAMLPNPRRVK